MKKLRKKGNMVLGLAAVILSCGLTAQAAGQTFDGQETAQTTGQGSVQTLSQQTVRAGIYADDIDLSGKSADEVSTAVEAYVEGLRSEKITFQAVGGSDVTVSAGDLGIMWVNTDLPKQALGYGTVGNVIERYKALKDLEYETYSFDIELDFDKNKITDVLTEQCSVYDIKALNAGLTKGEDGRMIVTDGVTGQVVDVDASTDTVYRYLTEEWDKKPCSIGLVIVSEEPKGSEEELSQLTDLLGSFTTSYSTSGSSRCANVENGCRLINGTVLYPGEEFSTYQTVSPFSTANGYYMAGSYMNGKVVNSLGGGICQVSTTLYNAVLLSELEVTERYNHSMIVTYVDPSADAAIAESAGKDFKFVNNLDYPIYIEGYTEGKTITFNIYGKDTRDKNREVKYESEVLQVIRPDHENIYADGGRPIGYVASEGAHIGYKARLWKVVTENGVEVSREQVNESNYKVTPRSATVGVATDDPNAYNQIMAAIETGSIDHVRNVAAALSAPPAQESAE